MLTTYLRCRRRLAEKRSSLCLVLFVFASCAFMYGQVPQTISYQGLLTNSSGTPLEGSYDLTFRLYTTPTGGTAIWSETHASVSVQSGTFSVILGSTTPLAGIPFDQQLYLGLAVGADPEMSPRSALTSAPSALIANDVADNAVTTEKITNVAVTTTKINSSGAADGQALMFDGSSVVWGNPRGRLTLPYADSAFTPVGQAVVTVTSTGTTGGYGIRGQSNAPTGVGVTGQGPLMGVSGISPGYGVYGLSDGPDGRGVYGFALDATGYGVYGWAGDATGTNYGVYGATPSSAGTGVYGLASATTGQGIGVKGQSNSLFGWGVQGSASGTGGIGLYGLATHTTGENYGIWGASLSPTGRGVYGVAPTYGVYGNASAASDENHGVHGLSNSDEGRGVYGEAMLYGVQGRATTTYGSGVHAVGGLAGVIGIHTGTTTGYGVYGQGFNRAGYFSGNLEYTGNLIGPSDERLKENIQPISNGLAMLMQLTPRSFTYRKNPEFETMHLASGTQYGLVAHELEKVFPELVVESRHLLTSPDDTPTEPRTLSYKGVKYIDLIPVLIRAIQEQQGIIEELKVEVTRLSGEKN